MNNNCSTTIMADHTADEVVKFLWKSQSKTCNIDPVPQRIIKRQVDILAPFIMLLFNRSMAEGIFPEAFKNTTIISAENNRTAQLGFKEFQMVSNLSLLSKILKKVVHSQMVAHLKASDAMPKTQSAYRCHHSTEAALLKEFSDIATAVDCGHVTALCQLDQLAAFDTVDHFILLQRLEKTFSFTDLTIKQLRFYLEN